VNLSANFTLKELTVTDTGLSNEPNQYQMEKLFYLCQFILQPIRDYAGTILVTSGFRSKEVNGAVGGSVTSQHPAGEAADTVPQRYDIDKLFNWIISHIIFGQCIRESKNGKDWIHISLPRLNKENQQALIYENGVYRKA